MSDEVDNALRSLESTVKAEGAGSADPLPLVDKHRYALERELGRGAQSVVFLALDGTVGREVAFKVARDPGEHPAFVREARVTGQLEHPGIVPVYEIGRDERGQAYCTQKLVRGRSLRAALEACSSPAQRLALLPHLIDVCNAVAYAHSRGVVHRDLKPENVMVGEFGETVVLDWGIAKVLGDVDARVVPRPLEGVAPQHTLAGSVMGTPLYLSPEQAAGDVAAIDRRSDVWSIGVMLYELIAGKLPFEAASVVTLLEKVRAAAYLPLSEAFPGVSPELSAIVAHALRRDPADRFADAAALAAELSAFRAGGRLTVYEYSSWELIRRFVARNQALTAVVIAAVLLLGGAGAIAFANYRRAERNLVVAEQRLATELLTRANEAEADLDWNGALSLFELAGNAVDSDEARWGTALTKPLETPRTSVGRVNAGRVLRAHFDREGKRVLVLSRKWVVLANAAGTTLGEWDRSEAGGGALAAGGDWFATAGSPARLVDATTLQPRALEGAPDAVVVAFSPDTQLLAVGHRSLGVQLYAVPTGTLTRSLEGLSATPQALAFSPDGRRLAASTEAGAIAVWDLERGVRTHLLQSRAFPYALLFDRSGRLFAGDQDRLIDVFFLDTTQPNQTLTGHRSAISGLALSPNDRFLASASQDGTILVWDTASLRPLVRLVASADVVGLSFAPDGASLDAFTLDGERLSWNLTRLPPTYPGKRPGDFVFGLDFSPDGRRLAWSHLSGGITGVTLGDGAVTRRPERMMAIAWSPASDELAAGSREGAVSLLDATTLHEVAVLDAGSAGVRTVAYSGDGQSVWVGVGSSVQRWTRADQRLQLERDGGVGRVAALALSADSRRIAWSGDSKTVVLHDLVADKELARFDLPLVPVRAVAFSPDGARLAAGGVDGTLVVLDGLTGAEQCRAVGHTSAIWDLAFSVDGKVLASASLDRSVRLWDARCQQVATVPPIYGEATQVVWSPDGGQLAVGDTYGTVVVLQVATSAPSAR